MKKLIVVLVVAAVFLLSCTSESSQVTNTELAQQGAANLAIVTNQPLPDLGGYSFERQIIIDTYLARNNTIATYSYMITMDGKIIEICASIGYPIPYSTQLTNPMKIEDRYEGDVAIPNAEPNSLYPPGDAAATLVQCVNPDGSVSPVYDEWYVLAFPYRIKSDYQLERIGETSFSVQVK